MSQCMILQGDLHCLLAEMCPDRVAQAEVDQEVTRHAVLAEALTISLALRLVLRDHLQRTQVAELCLGNLGGRKRILEKRAGRRVAVDPDTHHMKTMRMLCVQSLGIEERHPIAASIRASK